MTGQWKAVTCIRVKLVTQTDDPRRMCSLPQKQPSIRKLLISKGASQESSDESISCPVTLCCLNAYSQQIVTLFTSKYQLEKIVMKSFYLQDTKRLQV